MDDETPTNTGTMAEITDLTMRRRADPSEGWDAICTVKTKNPSITLGEFTVEKAADASGKPIEGARERLMAGLEAFVESIANITYPVEH